MVVAFVIWSVIAVGYVIIGIRSKVQKKPVGFWNVTKPPKVTDVKKYNGAVAILWFVFAVLFELIGIPLLFCEQNSPVSVAVVFATVILVIGVMIVYMRIENKYRSK